MDLYTVLLWVIVTIPVSLFVWILTLRQKRIYLGGTLMYRSPGFRLVWILGNFGYIAAAIISIMKDPSWTRVGIFVGGYIVANLVLVIINILDYEEPHGPV